MKYHFEATAALIRFYRGRTDLSQTDLSRLMGYRNGQFISNVERALCSVPIKKLGIVCKVLNIPHAEMREALITDYQADILEGLNYHGDTDANEHEVLPVHTDPAANREDTRSALS